MKHRLHGDCRNLFDKLSCLPFHLGQHIVGGEEFAKLGDIPAERLLLSYQMAGLGFYEAAYALRRKILLQVGDYGVEVLLAFTQTARLILHGFHVGTGSEGISKSGNLHTQRLLPSCDGVGLALHGSQHSIRGHGGAEVAQLFADNALLCAQTADLPLHCRHETIRGQGLFESVHGGLQHRLQGGLLPLQLLFASGLYRSQDWIKDYLATCLAFYCDLAQGSLQGCALCRCQLLALGFQGCGDFGEYRLIFDQIAGFLSLMAHCFKDLFGVAAALGGKFAGQLAHGLLQRLFVLLQAGDGVFNPLRGETQPFGLGLHLTVQPGGGGLQEFTGCLLTLAGEGRPFILDGVDDRRDERLTLEAFHHGIDDINTGSRLFGRCACRQGSGQD